jgi:hypothetical protein
MSSNSNQYFTGTLDTLTIDATTNTFVSNAPFTSNPRPSTNPGASTVGTNGATNVLFDVNNSTDLQSVLESDGGALAAADFVLLNSS